ncbi:LysR family transcriptional regulator [Nocardia sp. NPDC058633]|uniref:LysR family transcriptional regulator n=1 Tax=Nocardia sp. NPDC058633 TaxID=3346568 RepID=UPI003646F534
MLDPVVLRSFLAVEHYRSFSQAARQLGVRQPTVSGHVKKLEASIGRELFVRDTHTVSLTTDGAAMVRFARTIVDAHHDALRYFGGEQLSGRIRFGVSEDLVSRALPSILLEFRRAYPLVDVELSIGLSEEIHAELRGDRLDLAFVKRRAGERHGQRVFDDNFVWAGPAGAVPDLSRPIPVVTYPPPALSRDAALGALEHAGLEYRITCTTTGQLGMRAAVLAGLGYLVHTESLLPPDVFPVSGLPRPRPDTTQFVLIPSSRRAQSAPEKALARVIVENTDRLKRGHRAGAGW